MNIFNLFMYFTMQNTTNLFMYKITIYNVCIIIICKVHVECYIQLKIEKCK